MELENLLSKIEVVKKDIFDYISNTEHYIFNWISNEEIQRFIEEYPNDYEDRIYLRIINVGTSPTIRIYFEGHPDDIEYIERSTVLSTFKDSTKSRWLRWNGKVKEMRIAEKEDELKYLKEQLEKTENALEKLKRN